MRVYISVDMEGVAGVVHADQVRRRGGHDYPLARQLMSREANAAALGAFDAGATEVLINDSHGDMRNLLFDELDPRVQVITGNLKPFSMAQGVHDGRFDVALFVGYHAAMGTSAAILDHTYRGGVIHQLRVNGQMLNEAGLNALIAGAVGTPVGLVTGDEATCRQCERILGDVETVCVKWAIGRLAAQSLHPEEACRLIREGARRAVEGRARFRPFVMESPYELEVELTTSGAADAAALLPGSERRERTLLYSAPDAQTLFRALMCVIRLGGTGIV